MNLKIEITLEETTEQEIDRIKTALKQAINKINYFTVEESKITIDENLTEVYHWELS